MNKYTAKFSTGEVARTSEHKYVAAAAFIHKVTGEIKNPTFSAKQNPKPATPFFKIERKWFRTRLAYEQALQKDAEARKEWAETWNLETVTL